MIEYISFFLSFWRYFGKKLHLF